MNTATLDADNPTLNWTDTLYGVPTGAEMLALRNRALGSNSPQLFVCHHDKDLALAQLSADFFLSDFHVLTFPAWDCLPYDRVSPASHIMTQRIATLSTLASPPVDKPLAVLTTASALLQKIPPQSIIKQSTIALNKGDTLDNNALQNTLIIQGYRRASKVMEAGEYAVRGSIVDIFPSGATRAIRLDFFGDDLESLNWFDPLTQRTEETAETLTLFPASEVLLTDETIQRFRSRYREMFGAAHREDALYHAISDGNTYHGMEHWLPLFYEQCDTLYDYLPESIQTNLHASATSTLNDRIEMAADYYEARREYSEDKTKNKLNYNFIYNPLPIDYLYTNKESLKYTLNATHAVEFSALSGSERDQSLPMKAGKSLYHISKSVTESTPIDQLIAATENYKVQNVPTLVCCQSEGSLSRVQALLKEKDYPCTTITHWNELKGRQAGCYLTAQPLAQGFESPDAIFYSEHDIFGQTIIRTRRKKNREAEAFLAEAAGFEEGELLVHKDHGIGRFDGLVTMETSGIRNDCLKLIYKGDDRLFLPVENIDMLTRFGSEESGSAELDKLGAGSWQMRKARMKERVKMAAEELMKIAGMRAIKQAPILQTPHDVYESFVSKFPYDETEDQARVIDEVIEDLASGKPMDRLVCGDVGFGKTEVALRAAFVTAATTTDGNVKQVALICPTTLLARQHYHNFSKRFEGTGIKVAQLSRLVSAKNANLAREGLEDGSVHIIIGTHALLSSKVKFKKLALVIVDEEQRFGVKQKEKLKAFKENVHVLTLSATPIPRTLQMALSGVRELSLMTTPPVDRLAIRSFVMPFDPIVVGEAIQREMHRGGQVFYVAPRIKDLSEVRRRISEIAPTARIAMANGQMAAGELDEIMNKFYEGAFDILLSTAIIESGIDIPTANTMIIHRADKFGLAQLYQMRGRVGRGKVRAYAYFTLEHHRNISKDATRRLEVMQTLDTLGAGFTLASHDMDIRGFGNMVGEEQSGHVKEVGVELYQHMLQEAIEEAKHNASLEEKSVDKATSSDAFTPQVNLGISLLIPEAYIEDLPLRLSLYRRLAKLEDEAEVESFAAEMVDRFGPLPEEVTSLLGVLSIKRECRDAYIEKIDAGPKGIVISFFENSFPKPDALIGYIARHSRTAKIRPDQSLFIAMEMGSTAERIKRVREHIHTIAGLLS